LQGAALIHSCGGDYTAVVRNSFQASKFARGKLHRFLQECLKKMNAKRQL
jgi:hypothetical protein